VAEEDRNRKGERHMQRVKQDRYTEALTLIQVAHLLQVRYRTLLDWIHDGTFQVPVVRVGPRSLRVSRTELLRFLAGSNPKWLMNGRRLEDINEMEINEDEPLPGGAEPKG
jgi:excisionase family DNA binding protein